MLNIHQPTILSGYQAKHSIHFSMCTLIFGVPTANLTRFHPIARRYRGQSPILLASVNSHPRVDAYACAFFGEISYQTGVSQADVFQSQAHLRMGLATITRIIRIFLRGIAAGRGHVHKKETWQETVSLACQYQ
jgi:hypothetical protein